MPRAERLTAHPICCSSFKVEDVHPLVMKLRWVQLNFALDHSIYSFRVVFSALHFVVLPLNGDGWESNKFYGKIYILFVKILSCSGELCLYGLKANSAELEETFEQFICHEPHPWVPPRDHGPCFCSTSAPCG